jgi:hypothetical protein
MPFENVPSTQFSYGLMSFGADGCERTDDPAGLMSARLIEKAQSEQITDIFFFSHGWHGDIASALDQYNRWLGSFLKQTADFERAKAIFPNFRPLLIGLHWPSEPWGEEDIRGGVDFSAFARLSPSTLFSNFVKQFGDTPEVRSSLETILDEARNNAAVDELSPRARDAYTNLNNLLDIGNVGVGGAPDADRDGFDPDEIVRMGSEGTANFGTFSLGGLLAPLRVLSYWMMKKRARSIGEGGMFLFLKDIMDVTSAGRVRIHLMGHSFGTIVVSGMVGGPTVQASLPRPVNSLVLVQGAVSLWSYSQTIPFPGAGEGYFHRLVTDHKVEGALVTTRSKYDRAVGVLYPLASKIRGAPDFAAGLPKYGGIGTFGMQGLSNVATIVDSPMLPAERPYNFRKGNVYNLEGSAYISQLDGLSGAHNDIAGPEVAHTIWEATLATD